MIQRMECTIQGAEGDIGAAAKLDTITKKKTMEKNEKEKKSSNGRKWLPKT